MLNATFQTGAYTRKVASVKAQSLVEIKFSGQDIGEVVAVYPQISLNSAEVASGRTSYGGRLICTVVYADESGALCRIQKGAEFSHHHDDERFAPAQHCDCQLSAERTQLKREGSSYVVSIVVGAQISVFESAQRSFISDVEGAVCRREEGKLFNAVSFSGESEVDDDFDCVASDILVPSARALVLDCNVKTGLIEVSGEIYLTLLAVRDGSPVGLDRVIPFKAEISCEEAVLPRRGVARAEIKDMSVDCRVNEDSGKCDVDFNATLAIFGRFCEEEQVTFVSDLFSAESQIVVTRSDERENIFTDLKVYSERVSGLCATKAKVDYTCSFLATALPEVEFSRTEGGIEGSVSATLIYSQGGEIHSTQVSLPFAVKLSGLSAGDCAINIAVCGISIRQRAEGECEAEAVLKITAEDGAENCVSYLTEVQEGEAREVNDSAISVYIPTAGDDLWETAKKLLSPPESIQATNPELKFPLTGKERILIFRPRTQ